MKKILSQKEIDEMIRSARHSPEVTAPIVQPPGGYPVGRPPGRSDRTGAYAVHQSAA